MNTPKKPKPPSWSKDVTTLYDQAATALKVGKELDVARFIREAYAIIDKECEMDYFFLIQTHSASGEKLPHWSDEVRTLSHKAIVAAYAGESPLDDIHHMAAIVRKKCSTVEPV